MIGSVVHERAGRCGRAGGPIRRTRAIRATTLVLSLAGLPLTVAQSQPVAPEPRTGSESAADLRELLEPLRTEHNLPALAAAVVRDGKLAALGAVGKRRIDADAPVDPDDRFHIGSCTKSMTATVCAMLVERGRLEWSSTVGDVFSGLRDAIHADFQSVTLEQLLCHRGGLPEDRRPGPVFFKLRMLSGDMREQRRKAVEIILADPPASPPGSKFDYSNNGYVVAGAMAEQVAGKTWEELMRELLFEPLGMTSAGFGPPGMGVGKTERVAGSEPDPSTPSASRPAESSTSSTHPDQPWGHRAAGKNVQAVAPSPFADNPAVTGPAGNVHCSLADWAKYATFHFDGKANEKTLLKPPMLGKLHTDVFEQGYAFGWGLRRQPWADGPVLQHAGSNTMWFAVIQVAPEKRAAILVATNQGDDAAQKACAAATDKLTKQFFPQK